ncbi:MAG TPA: hypothetical protein VFN10_16960, partial [Thermoanaerobaculia bacterium]|nr:hypothetical protein [Thermoanaerobaculia bacterium]
MVRTIVTMLLALWAAAAQAQFSRDINVYATGGKSLRTWHGQADVELLNIEFRRELSPRYDLSTVIAPANFRQPRSWF